MQQKIKNKKCKIKRLKLIALITFSLNFFSVTAQTSVNSSGGTAKGNGGLVSYSVGQLVYTTHSGTNGLIAQGIQQPYEISVIKGINNFSGIGLIAMAYPNPMIDYLILEIKTLKLSNLSFALYDMHGQLLQSKRIANKKTSIYMGNCPAAAYFLKITQNDTEIKSLKIIKNH